MSVKGFKRTFKAFDILTADQVEAIHQATLKVLLNTGVVMNDEQALKIMADGGCEVDFQANRVRIPERLVMDSLTSTPQSWIVKARNPENDFLVGGKDRTHIESAGGMMAVDPGTWETHEPSRKEFFDHIKVIDSLPNNGAMGAFPFFGWAKVPQAMRLIESHAAKVRLSSKSQVEGNVMDNDIWHIEICKATGQEMRLLCNPTAPLTFSDETIQKVFRNIEADMPFHFASGPISGATAPASMAGAVVLNNADALAGIVLTQLIKPGFRVWVGSLIMVQNMRSGSPAFGAISNSMIEAVYNQVWRWYGVPNWTSASAWTSSKAVDYQAAYEASLAALSSALSGANVVLLQGGLTGELSASTAKMILDDDIAGMIGRYLQGVDVSEESLAVELIDQVGPVPGQFITTPHTLEWWRKEQYLPLVADRLGFEEWARKGKKTALDHAQEKAEEYIANFKHEPLSASQEKAVEDILTEARKYYRHKGLISDEEWKLYQKDLASADYPYA